MPDFFQGMSLKELTDLRQRFTQTGTPNAQDLIYQIDQELNRRGVPLRWRTMVPEDVAKSSKHHCEQEPDTTKEYWEEQLKRSGHAEDQLRLREKLRTVDGTTFVDVEQDHKLVPLFENLSSKPTQLPQPEAKSPFALKPNYHRKRREADLQYDDGEILKTVIVCYGNVFEDQEARKMASQTIRSLLAKWRSDYTSADRLVSDMSPGLIRKRILQVRRVHRFLRQSTNSCGLKGAKDPFDPSVMRRDWYAKYWKGYRGTWERYWYAERLLLSLHEKLRDDIYRVIVDTLGKDLGKVPELVEGGFTLLTRSKAMLSKSEMNDEEYLLLHDRCKFIVRSLTAQYRCDLFRVIKPELKALGLNVAAVARFVSAESRK